MPRQERREQRPGGRGGEKEGRGTVEITRCLRKGTMTSTSNSISGEDKLPMGKDYGKDYGLL